MNANLGFSVLEQLDRELKRRGDLFRDLSVQDLAGYRASGHPEPMPRVMLIIDEFQELFVEDDKLAQDCSLVLDRLVRQGRAFGMHVLSGISDTWWLIQSSASHHGADGCSGRTSVQRSRQ